MTSLQKKTSLRQRMPRKSQKKKRKKKMRMIALIS